MRSVNLVRMICGFVSAVIGQVPPAAPPAAVPPIVPSPGIVISPLTQFQRSVPVGQATSSMALSLQDAIARGLRNNLGVLVLDTGTQLARAQRIRALSGLLPSIVGSVSEIAQQVNLATFGFRFPGIPTVVGPFEYADARAFASQSLFDWTAIKNHQSTTQYERAAVLSLRDGRDLVVQAVATAYLQIIADSSRIEATRAQVSTAQALYERAREQHRAGTSPAIDELRAQVQLKARQQELIAQSSQRDKDKLVLGRVIGLPLGQIFEISDLAPYVPLEGMTPEQALDRAYKTRADYESATMELRAAETALMAAHGERYPSLQIDGSYGALGPNPGHTNGTFTAAASLRFDIFDGGRSRADIEQAAAVIRNRKNELADLQGQIDFQVRSALLDLQTAADQVAVARDNLNLAEETLVQARNRFVAGVTDNIEVVQAQDSVANANASLISAILLHNLGKVSLARAVGATEGTLKQFMEGR